MTHSLEARPMKRKVINTELTHTLKVMGEIELIMELRNERWAIESNGTMASLPYMLHSQAIEALEIDYFKEEADESITLQDHLDTVDVLIAEIQKTIYRTFKTGEQFTNAALLDRLTRGKKAMLLFRNIPRT
jgi:exosome complex RNA-binding protein Rrp4